MNRIIELTSKFIPIKQKLETNSINELITRDDKTILLILNNQSINNSISTYKKNKKSINKHNTNNIENTPNQNQSLKIKISFLQKNIQNKKIKIIIYILKKHLHLIFIKKIINLIQKI